MENEKLIIVEGRSDKLKIQQLLAEPVQIICTNGTVSITRLEELLTPFDHCEMYVFVDADSSGEKLRSLIKREYPEAKHLYTNTTYKEVAATPRRVLASVLMAANMEIKPEYIA